MTCQYFIDAEIPIVNVLGWKFMCMYCDSTLRKVLDSVPPQCVMSSTKYFSVLENMFFF